MKKLIWLFSLIFLIVACGDNVIDEPNPPVENIIHDCFKYIDNGERQVSTCGQVNIGAGFSQIDTVDINGDDIVDTTDTSYIMTGYPYYPYVCDSTFYFDNAGNNGRVSYNDISNVLGVSKIDKNNFNINETEVFWVSNNNFTPSIDFKKKELRIDGFQGSNGFDWVHLRFSITDNNSNCHVGNMLILK